MKTVEVGQEVGYAESFSERGVRGVRGMGRRSEVVRVIRWVKVGTVVEVNTEAGRARVKWDRWEYESGSVKKDSKRTWVKIDRLNPYVPKTL